MRMTNRISSHESTVIKEQYLGRLGRPYQRIANSLYLIRGGTVNVKLTRPRSSGRYWFNIQKRADSFLWICWNKRIQESTYYWIPAREMRELIALGAYRDWTWERRGRRIPNFMIDTITDEYVAGKTRVSIRQFRDVKHPPLNQRPRPSSRS